MKPISSQELFGLAFLASLCVAFAGAALAWNGPSGTAPANNVSAPINVGTASQIKDGALGVNSLAVYGNGYFSGNLGVGVVSPSEALEVSGTVKATSFIYSSDALLKHDIQTIDKASETIKQLRGVSFRWNDSGRRDIGLIAQEVEQVVPDIVHTDSNGVKSVEYGNLIAVLIEAIKEQEAELLELRMHQEQLLSKIKALESSR